MQRKYTKKIMIKAYIFPGQGSQFSGMGKELYESNHQAREMMDKADEILGFKLTEIMFNGTDQQLKATEVTQPAIFLYSVCEALCNSGDTAPAMVAGHSLGEFSALVCAGSMGFEDGMRLVAKRAQAMQRCCETVPGSMAAIIGLSEEAVEQVCKTVAGTVVPANYNSDGQIVISGEDAAVEEAMAKALEAGARKAVKLNVSGAFHSPLMQPAREELAKAIESTPILAPRCPVYQNVSASASTDPEVIKKLLLEQLTSPVKWTQSVKAMMRDGAEIFEEKGPGNVLQGLLRRIKL